MLEPDALRCPAGIPELFAAQVALRPDTAAVITDGEVVSYLDLHHRSNRLAHRLISSEIGRDGIVAVCLPRSIDAISCWLGVLKAGGAYLPIDPAQPVERIASMLADAKPAIVITTAELSARLSTSSVSVMTPADFNDDQNFADVPNFEVSGGQLAYVIYTSGSTGQPKGVEVTHDNLINLIEWHQNEFQVQAVDRASHLASVGFDAAVWEVWPYLTAGASLYLPSDETRISPEALRDWLVSNQISITFLPTALAERVMLLEWPASTALRFLLTGADTLHRRPATNLPFEIVNNYGPTECTVVATSGRVSPIDSDGLPAIGRAIASTEIYLLDENLRPVAPGETGELYIGGAGVARGYLNRPDLTLEKFLLDPFNLAPGARMYRTGDLARMRANGEFAYVGRVDEQIKILGYRIEPAEIEAVIDRHPSIAESVVVARGCDCADMRLTAYVTLRNGTTPSATELREHLRSVLPDYMLPATYVKVEGFPLTVSGKIDRTLLPEPTIDNSLRDQDFSAPSSILEKRLAAIICELFKLQTVSVNDNFFLLGGHSLLGAQLIIKIRAEFGVDLALRNLFESPSIAELSNEIERLIVARIDRMTEAEAQALLG